MIGILRSDTIHSFIRSVIYLFYCLMFGFFSTIKLNNFSWYNYNYYGVTGILLRSLVENIYVTIYWPDLVIFIPIPILVHEGPIIASKWVADRYNPKWFSVKKFVWAIFYPTKFVMLYFFALSFDLNPSGLACPKYPLWTISSLWFLAIL